MAGFDFAARLRRGLGRGKVISTDLIAEKLAPFDGDKDGALECAELTAFFQKNGVGPWVSTYSARSLWTLIETWYGGEVRWVKIPALAQLIHDNMAIPPKEAKRRRITPEGMQGYEPMEDLDAYEERIQKENDAGPPRRPRARGRGRGPRRGPRSRPSGSGRPRSGRTPRRGPRR